jgi:hypothetical protein|tara:strand:- start:1610 stop:1903 length:294 start_codon:yes stop_codon:yes gene_type:complete
MANYQYCVASNWGKGFITNSDALKLEISGFPGDVWKVNANNQDANRWISGVAGDRKTLSEAQAIVDAEITQAQNDWDALSDEEKATVSRPENITLTE